MAPTSLGYAAAYRDPTTSAYPLGDGYRFFCPSLLRFTAPDRSSPFGSGGPNCYAYCNGDPINLTDPSGHAPGFGVFTMVMRWIGTGVEETASLAAMDAADTSIAAREASNARPHEIDAFESNGHAAHTAPNAGGSHLEQVPSVVMEKIVSNLDGKNLGRLLQASKTMNASVINNLTPLEKIFDADTRNMESWTRFMAIARGDYPGTIPDQIFSSHLDPGDYLPETTSSNYRSKINHLRSFYQLAPPDYFYSMTAAHNYHSYHPSVIEGQAAIRRILPGVENYYMERLVEAEWGPLGDD